MVSIEKMIVGLGSVEPYRTCRNLLSFLKVWLQGRQPSMLVVLDLSGMKQSKGGILAMVRDLHI